MKAPLAALIAVAVTLASAPALAQDPETAVPAGKPPSTGIGMIVTGSILTGLGAVNLITAPICKTSAIPDPTSQDVCLGTSLVLGGAFAAVGIPLLLVGVNRHNRYVEWKRQHQALSALTDLGVAPTRGGAALTWHTSF
jgi:hypothetical protein